MWCYLYETMEKHSSEYRVWTAKDVCGSYSVDRNRNYCRHHKELFFEDWIASRLDHAHMSDALIAPISGALMSAATASTTAGATLASSSFAETILAIGISAVWGAAMINSGATVLDHLPHGSFFHATGGVCELNFKERLKLIPYESLIGIVLTAGTTILYIISN